MGQGPGEALQLLGLRSRGDAEPVHLPCEHPAPETQRGGRAPFFGRGVHLDWNLSDGVQGRAEREILGRVVPRIHAHQRHQIAKPLDENGVQIQTRASLGLRPQAAISASTPQLRGPAPESAAGT